MKRENEGKDRKIGIKRIRVIVTMGLFLFLCETGFSQGNHWTLLPWGLNLEELNRTFKEKNQTGQISEDKYRSEIVLQYSPVKSLKARKGKLVALLSSTDPSTPGRLYGYAFEGKIFGRAIFFKDHPEIFPETVIGNLKKQYPQGKIIRNFSTPPSVPSFEYKSDQLYIFSTERGVFYYEPLVLEKVVKIELERSTLEERKIEKDLTDQLKSY